MGTLSSVEFKKYILTQYIDLDATSYIIYTHQEVLVLI